MSRRARTAGCAAAAFVLAAAGAPRLCEALTVGPSRVVLRAKPGQTRTGHFLVSNATQESLRVLAQPEDWAGGVGGGRGPVEWLAVRPTEFKLKPGKSRTVRFSATPPKGSVGELRAQVFFTSQTAGPGEGSGAGVRSRLGSIIYVTIEGTERLDAAITRIDAAYSAATPGISEPDRLEFAIGVHNRGNAHIVPGGGATVRDRTGQVVARLPIQKGWGLLPGQEDRYRAIGQGVHLQPGRYTLDLQIDYGEDLGQLKKLVKTVDIEIAKDKSVKVLGPEDLAR